MVKMRNFVYLLIITTMLNYSNVDAKLFSPKSASKIGTFVGKKIQNAIQSNHDILNKRYLDIRKKIINKKDIDDNDKKFYEDCLKRIQYKKRMKELLGKTSKKIITDIANNLNDTRIFINPPQTYNIPFIMPISSPLPFPVPVF